MNKEQTALAAVENRQDIMNIDAKQARRKLDAIAAFQAVVRNQLHEGHDYGVIPGTGKKPTLLKPGAEKIAKLLNLADDYEFLEKIEDWEKPLFRYLIKCTLRDMASGTIISAGLGECNTYESKYRYRWVPDNEIPAGIDKATLRKRDGKKTLFEFDFAIEKRETTGKYGNPKEHWDLFDQMIRDGKARRITKQTKSGNEREGYEIEVGQILYQAPNPDIFDQINTIVKMAKKRALVDATLSAGRLSDLFTQDLEDTTEVAEGPKAEPINGKRDSKFAPEETPIKADACNEKAIAEIDRLISTLVDKFGLDPGSIMAEIEKRLTVPMIGGKFNYGLISEELAEKTIKFLNSTITFQEKRATPKGMKK